MLASHRWIVPIFGSVPTIGLSGVRHIASHQLVADDVEFVRGKWCEKLLVGDVIEFDAEPIPNVSDDTASRWKLARPTKVVRINRRPQEGPPRPSYLRVVP
jgi:hypothetical protein